MLQGPRNDADRAAFLRSASGQEVDDQNLCSRYPCLALCTKKSKKSQTTKSHRHQQNVHLTYETLSVMVVRPCARCFCHSNRNANHSGPSQARCYSPHALSLMVVRPCACCFCRSNPSASNFITNHGDPNQARCRDTTW